MKYFSGTKNVQRNRMPSTKVAKSIVFAILRKQSITFTANVSEFCSKTHFCRKLAQEYICGQNSSFVWGTFSKKLTL